MNKEEFFEKVTGLSKRIEDEIKLQRKDDEIENTIKVLNKFVDRMLPRLNEKEKTIIRDELDIEFSKEQTNGMDAFLEEDQ